jgi:hypothetical protein
MYGEGRLRRRRGIALAPYFVCERSDTPTQQLPERISLLAILSEELVDDDDVDSQLFDLVGLRIIRTFRRRNQETEHKRGHCAYYAHAEPDSLLRIRAQMTRRQGLAQIDAEQSGAENAQECDE